MKVKVRTRRPDSTLKQIVEALKKYAQGHPEADVEVYRQNSVSVRVRVIDPHFEGQSPAQREEELWEAFDELPDEVAADISLLLLLTPEEAKVSLANLDFDDPIPSKL